MTSPVRKSGTKKDRPRGVQARNLVPLARKGKGAGASQCSDCGVVQHAGRWYWGAPPTGPVRAVVCPACRRVRTRYPAGLIRLHAGFLPHRLEIEQMARNVERAEMPAHPMERLIGVQASESEMAVTTTGIHIARQIAHKIARRFHQKARIRYASQEELIHVDWEERTPAEQRTRGAARKTRR